MAKERLPHLERLYEGLTPADIERLAYEVSDYKRSPETEQAIRTQRTEARDEHRDDVAMIRELAIDVIKEFVDAGLKRPTMRMIKAQIMRFGVFDEQTVSAVIWSQKQMSQYGAVTA